MDEETKFHWAEGMKYALEGMKSLLILNGAATLSVLTFVGNSKRSEDGNIYLFQTDILVYSMVCFALGAVTGPIVLFLAYITQLQYGNSGRNLFDVKGYWTKGVLWHYLAYAVFVGGILLFLGGVVLAGCAFKQAI